MSNNDSFIDEVSEEVRRDRLFGLIRRYGWIAVALVVVLVGGAAVVEWQRATARAEAEAFGDEVLAALDLPTPAERREALMDIEATGTREAMISMLAADTLEDDAARGSTLELLTEVGQATDVPQIWRELAVLKAAMIRQGQDGPEAVIAMLEPLTIPGAPYRLLALEQIAVAELRAGNRDGAIETLRQIQEDGAATRDLQGRVRQLIVAIGGDAASDEG